jgi:hypothetical protein
MAASNASTSEDVILPIVPALLDDLELPLIAKTIAKKMPRDKSFRLLAKSIQVGLLVPDDDH